MQLLHKMNVKLLVSLVAVSVVALTGCQTGGFTKPKLANLAFWKKDSKAMAAKSVPPPPALHFDPAPLSENLDKQSEIVNLDGGNLERRFENNMTEALSEINSVTKTPIRKPYSSDITPTENEFAPPSFATNTGNVRSKQFSFDKGESGAAGENLSVAQQEFQAAMKSATPSNTDGFATTPGHSNQFPQDWKDIKLPTGRSDTTQGVDPSLASVNQSLKNANLQIAKTGGNFTGAISTKANGFENNLKNKFGSAAQSTHDFAGEAKAKLTSALNPINDFASYNNFAPQGIATPGIPSASMKNNSRNGELKLAQDQVAEAKQQIERLKMQIQDAKVKAASNMPTGQSMVIQQPLASPPTLVAQVPIPSFNSTYANPDSIGGQPTNVLRSNNQPLLPKPTQPLVPTKSNRLSPNYPATPHGGFAPISPLKAANSNMAPTPNVAATQAGFASDANSSNVVTAGAQSQASGSAGWIQNHVSEINIPDSILKGTGSYAPGSVNALKK